MSDEIYRIGHPHTEGKGPVIRACDLYNEEGMTLGELIEWCFEHGLKGFNVKAIGSVHLRWGDYETDEEYVARKKWDADQAERKVKWEKEKLVDLVDRYPDLVADLLEGKNID